MLTGCSDSAKSATTTTTAPSYRVLVDAGLHLLAQHNVNAAEQLFVQAIRRDRRLPLAYYDLGVVYASEGLKQAAIAQYMHAVSVSPSFVPALYNEAVIEQTIRPRYAMSLYRHIIVIHPDASTSLLNLGLLEYATHQTSSAITDLRKAVRLDHSLAARVPRALRAEVRA